MITTRIIRMRPPRKPAESPPAMCPLPIIWHSAGGWSIGWGDDAPSGFPTRNFATDVWRSSRAQQWRTK